MESNILESYIQSYLRTGVAEPESLRRIDDMSWYGLICIYLRSIRMRRRYDPETTRLIIRHLHEHSTQKNTEDTDLFSWSRDAIATACFFGEEDIIHQLIDMGYPLRRQILHRVALNDSMPSVFNKLIDRGLDINELDDFNRTPLDISLNLAGRHKQVEFIVSKGGKVNFSYDLFDGKSVCRGLDKLLKDEVFDIVYDASANIRGMSADIVRLITEYHTFEGMGESSILSMIQLRNSSRPYTREVGILHKKNEDV